MASLQETYGAASVLADELKEDVTSQDEAARGLTASLIEACKDKSSGACKAALEARRKFGLNQLASVKGHQLKALIKLESAVTAGDQLAVNVLSKQLAAINQRSASEQQAESSFNFVPEQVFVAVAPQLVQVAQNLTVAAAAAPVAAAAAAAAQNATVAVVAVVNATVEAPPPAAAAAAANATAAVVSAQVQQVLHQAQKEAGQQHEQEQALASAPGLVQNASSFQELAAPQQLSKVSDEALATVAAGAKQEWKTERQAWESKRESRINALMKHEKDMQNDQVARDLKGENEAKARAAKSAVEYAAKEKMHEKLLADRAAQSKVEATKEAARLAREAAAKAKEEMARVADAQMAKVEAASARGVQAAKDEKAKVEAMKASLQSHLAQVAGGAAPPAQQQAPSTAGAQGGAPSTAPRSGSAADAMPKDFLAAAAPVVVAAPAAAAAPA